MSLCHIEEILGVDTKTAPVSVVLEAMTQKGLRTYEVTAENAQGEPLGCMILCTDLKLVRKLAAVLQEDTQVDENDA